MVLLPLGVAIPILQIRTSRKVEIEVVKLKSSSVLWHHPRSGEVEIEVEVQESSSGGIR